jgi:tyrosyl-DNA phosphodiesterase-1
MANQDISYNEDTSIDVLANTPGSTSTSDSTQIATPAEPTPTLPPVLSGRAQMEQERIARQKAREAQNGIKPTASSSVNVKPTLPSSNARIATMSDLSSQNAEAGPSSNGVPKPVNNVRPPPPKPTYHPLQSAEPFPIDAAGEYYLDGEMRHNALSIGSPSTAPTFSPKQIVGKVSLHSRPCCALADQVAQRNLVDCHVQFLYRRRMAQFYPATA